MKKRITALWLAALIIFSLSACGKKEADDKSLPSGDTTTAAKVSDVKITPSEAKQTKLVDYKTSDFSMKLDGIPKNRKIIPIENKEAHATFYCCYLKKNEYNPADILLKMPTLYQYTPFRAKCRFVL